ncbi:MAG: polysaccharide biosynthesis tyrosine autokinase, partial [Cyanobacteria bacterium P01_G01_bin.19]
KGSELQKPKDHQFKELLSLKTNHYQNRAAFTRAIDSPQTLTSNLNLEESNHQAVSPQPAFNLSNLISILKRRSSPALMGFSGVLLGAILYLIFAQRSYQTTASIILEDRQESISELGKNLSSVLESREYSPLVSQLELVRSRSALNTALNKVAQEKDVDLTEQITVDEIRENLGVKIIPNTNILEVNYVNSDPELAQLLLNGIIQAVIERNTDSIRSEARSVKEFLEQQVSKQRQELRKFETAENSFREKNGIVALDNQTANLVNSLNDLETQEQSLLTQIKEQESKVESLQQIAKVNDAETAYNQGIIAQDRQLEDLRTQLTNIESELAAARSNFTDNNPIVISLLEKEEETLSLYQERVRNVLGEGAILAPELTEKGFSQDRDGLGHEVFVELIANQTQLEANRDKLEAIAVEKEKINNRIASLPAQVQSLTELLLQREQANESLQFLQRKLEEATIAEAQLVSNIQIVEQASLPSAPSSPQVILVLAMASIVGTILATSIVLLLEKIDHTLYDVEEVESQLNIPFLTALPHLPGSTEHLNQIKLFLQNRDLYEPYRYLLKRLESSGSKVIVVTSATAGEGKSAVALHLSAVSAMLSRRTLIIDAHLDRPTQHRLFDVELQPGVTEIVANKLSLAEVVQSTQIKNLSVLSSGISTSNSCQILESPLIKNILQDAAIQYDLVIIDAPSVGSNCDAYTLSKYSNGLVMVTRPCYTNKNILEQTVKDLRRNKASIVGFVINNADKEKQQSNSDRNIINHSPSLLLNSIQANNFHRNTNGMKQS